MPPQPDNLVAPAEPRALPNSLDAEKGLLGSMLLAPQDVIPECVDIDGTAFYLPANATIYEILVSLWSDGTPIDFITLTQVLRDRKLLDVIGGAAYVTHLFCFTPTAANAGYYREIVEEKAILRRLIKAGTDIVERAYEDRQEVAVLLDSSEASILAIAEKRARAAIIPLKDRIHATLDRLEQAYANRGQVTGLATGFKEIDQITNGLQRSEMIVVAARPSVGKTALAMNIAEFVAGARQETCGRVQPGDEWRPTPSEAALLVGAGQPSKAAQRLPWRAGLPKFNRRRGSPRGSKDAD
jgi:replicative DNA helicase